MSVFNHYYKRLVSSKNVVKHNVLMFFIACFFCIIHIILFPYSISIHPDTTGSIEAGKSLVSEGKLLQPFSWRYVFERKGKITMPRHLGIVNLEKDHREPVNWYPPGYSFIVASGLFFKLSASQTCTMAFYFCMFIAMLTWLYWAQRVKIPLFIVTIALTTYLPIGPATITDPFGWAIAGLLLLLATFRYSTLTMVTGALLMGCAVLIRHAAIFLPLAWGIVWLKECQNGKQRSILIGSCLFPIIVDFSSKFFKSGTTNVMGNLWDGGWPSHTEVIKAAYYSLNGGWSPSHVLLKLFSMLLCLISISYLITIFRKKRVSKWIRNILIIQFATLIVLCGAQYKYGADFTKAPIAIARYWHYVTPGLICLQFIGFDYFLKKFLSNKYYIIIIKNVFIVFFLLAIVELVVNTRVKFDKMKSSEDGFSRSYNIGAVQQELRNNNYLAVITDSHQHSFTLTNPKSLKNLFYLDGFFSEQSGQIALLTTGTKRGAVTLEKCLTELELVSNKDIIQNVINLSVFKLPANKVIHIEKTSAQQELQIYKRGN